MFQLEFYRRLANGSLSEAFGPGADNTNVNADILSTTLGFYRSAQQTLDILPSEVQTILNSYTNGINAYLETNQHLAPEFGSLIYNMKPKKMDTT